jgi:predicted N-formylglutamate amidohydrolase
LGRLARVKGGACGKLDLLLQARRMSLDEPFTLIPPAPGAQSMLLFLCDHASNRVPPEYGNLGLARKLFETHIAYDIGAAPVTRALAESYGAAALLGGVSRLLIDLNRGPDDPTLVMKLSDGSIIPGNRDADAQEVARRMSRFHAPYHAAIRNEIARLGEGATLVSIHSFTPAWKGVGRVWEIGVLYGRDARLAKPLMKHLQAAGFTVGDNEPYTGALEGDTLDTHGTRTGHANVLIEIRQDFLDQEEKARAFATRLKPVLDAGLKEMES